MSGDTLHEYGWEGKNEVEEKVAYGGMLRGLVVEGGRLLGTDERFIHVRARISMLDKWYGLAALYRYKGGVVSPMPLCRVAVNGALQFISDTLQDINGDGWKDYVWKLNRSGGYLSSTDCIHLYNSAQHAFNDGIELLCHPTYYPKEGVIRGMECDNPANRSLYTARFNGNTINIVEILSLYPPVTATRYDPSKPRTFVRRRLGSVEFLHALPEEYLTVEYLATFLSPP